MCVIYSPLKTWVKFHNVVWLFNLLAHQIWSDSHLCFSSVYPGLPMLVLKNPVLQVPFPSILHPLSTCEGEKYWLSMLGCCGSPDFTLHILWQLMRRNSALSHLLPTGKRIRNETPCWFSVGSFHWKMMCLLCTSHCWWVRCGREGSLLFSGMVSGEDGDFLCLPSKESLSFKDIH